MSLKRFRMLFMILLMASLCLSIASAVVDADDPSDDKEKKIQVFVSILPQAYFVERIGGPQVEVTVLVGPGQSPATYEPSPHDIAHLSDAEIYFKIGVPFEHRLLEKAQKIIPDLYVVDTRAGIKLRLMEDPDPHPDHDHGEGGEDPHIWLNPMLVKIQAETICRELKKLRPSRSEEFDQNLAAFKDDLDKLDSHIAERLAPYAGRRFYVFHPSYGYFSDRYGLRQVAVEISGKDPGARQLGYLIEQARGDGIHVVFAQSQFATGTVEAIAHAIDGKVVLLDPLSRDYIKNLEQMTERIVEAFQGSKRPAGPDQD